MLSEQLDTEHFQAILSRCLTRKKSHLKDSSEAAVVGLFHSLGSSNTLLPETQEQHIFCY